MSMNILADVAFESVRGRRYNIRITKRGYVGEVYNITPAVDPFTTEENTSEDPMEPVRGSTGYFRFMYDGGLNADGEPWFVDFLPADSTEILVMLKDEQNNILWQGFIKPSAYSQDYDRKERIIELPLCSPLEVLNGVEMDAENIMHPEKMAGLFWEATEKIGVQYSYAVVPYEWGTETWHGEQEELFNFTAPLCAEASRFAWFDTTDAKNDGDPNWREYKGATYGEMMADWCRFWGWTLREDGETLYFVSRRAQSYCRLAYQMFRGMPEDVDPEFIREQSAVVRLTDEKLDGINHTFEAVPGVRTVEVDADTQEIETDVVMIGDNDAVYYGSERDNDVYRELGGGPNEALYRDQHLKFEIKGGRAKVWNELSGAINQITGEPIYWKFTEWRYTDLFYWADEAGKKNYNYTPAVYTYLDMNTLIEPYISDRRILEVRGKKSVDLDSGWFCINIDIEDYRGTGVQERFHGLMALILKVGDYCWDGTQWVNHLSVWGLLLDPQDGNFWKYATKNTKTLDMNCNGAEGYLIKIDRHLVGEVSLTWTWLPDQAQNGKFLIKNFGVEYYPDDGNWEKDKKSVNKYYATTGATGTETKTIGLRLASDNDNNPGYGILKYNGAKVNGQTYITPERPGEDAEPARPEDVLLDTARQAYGVRRQKLTMITELAGKERPFDVVKRSEWRNTWRPVAERIDWANDRRTVTLIG